MTNSKLMSIKELFPIIKHIAPHGSTICLYESTGKYLGNVSNNGVAVPYKEGEIVDFNTPEFEAVRESMRAGKVIHNVLPREVFGFAIEGDIIPISEQGKVVGVMITFYSTELHEQIKERSNALNNDIGNVNDAVGSIGSSSKALSLAISDIHSASCKVEEKIRETNEITKVVSRSATRSNVLALNASIEAARAGTAGKGFAVVASEMGKFSKESVELAKKIDDTLNEVSSLIDKVKEAVTTSRDAADDQLSAVEEIMGALERVVGKSMELAELSSKNAL